MFRQPQPALLLSGALRTPEKQKLLSAAGLVVDRAGRRGRMREYGRGHEVEEGEEHEPQPGCGEGAGQAAANCAAVCCCCPLALLDMLLLVTVKLPAGVMRRVRRRRSRHRDLVSRKKRSATAAAVEPASPSGSSGKAMIARIMLDTTMSSARLIRLLEPSMGLSIRLMLAKPLMLSLRACSRSNMNTSGIRYTEAVVSLKALTSPLMTGSCTMGNVI